MCKIQEDLHVISDNLSHIIKNPAFPTNYHYDQLKTNISKLNTLPVNNVMQNKLKQFLISMRIRLQDIKLRIDAGKKMRHVDVNELMDTLTLFIDNVSGRPLMLRSAAVRSRTAKLPISTKQSKHSTTQHGGKRKTLRRKI